MKKLKIYLLKRIGKTGFDEYEGCVVAAESEEAALTIAPNGKPFDPLYSEWVKDVSQIKCTEIGSANKQQKTGVIMASYNAA